MKRANGEGHIRKRADGRWEGQYTVGHDPVTGKAIRKSVYGKKQNDVRKKLDAILSELDDGTYREPTDITVGEWMDIWLKEYTIHLKPRTRTMYTGFVRNHIGPLLGKIPLQKLQPHDVQRAYNRMSEELAPKTVRNVHGILHKALTQAVANGIIKSNPSVACTLPKALKPKIEPLTEDELRAFVKRCSEAEDGLFYIIDLFTGMRQSEILGLTWDNVDMDAGVVRITQQLQLVDGEYILLTPKHDKNRTISISPFVIDLFRRQAHKQKVQQIAAGPLWENTQGFVFTDPVGDHMKRHTIYKRFKKIVADIGRPDTRFHDLRHTYAVSSLRAGDDIKTLQENLGHHTAAFTLDVYGHVTEEMRRESAERQQAYIDSLGI